MVIQTAKRQLPLTLNVQFLIHRESGKLKDGLRDLRDNSRAEQLRMIEQRLARIERKTNFIATIANAGDLPVLAEEGATSVMNSLSSIPPGVCEYRRHIDWRLCQTNRLRSL